MLPLTGYTDRLSAAPGERIAFKVSSTAAGPYRASLARVVHADPNPAGPGVKIEDLAHRFAIERPSRVQLLALGLLRARRRRRGAAHARPAHRGRARLADPRRRARAVRGLALGRGATVRAGRCTGPSRRHRADRRSRRRAARARHGPPLGTPPVASDLAGGRPGLGYAARRPRRRWPAGAGETCRAAAARGAARRGGTAAGRGPPGPEVREHFNGKIEDPLLLAAAATAPEALVLDPLLPPEGLVAGWDFSQGIDGLDVVDIGPQRLGGRLVNLPTRARHRGALDGARDVLAPRAPRVRGHPLPRRRCPRRRLGDRFRVHGAGEPAERRLRHAPRRGRPRSTSCPSTCGRRADGLARTCSSSRRPTPTRPTPTTRAATPTPPSAQRSPHGAPIPTTRTIIPSTAGRPTTGTATAAASATPRACAPC